MIEDVTPPEEQKTEDLAAVIPSTPPSLPMTSLQELEVVYGTAFHLNNGI